MVQCPVRMTNKHNKRTDSDKKSRVDSASIKPVTLCTAQIRSRRSHQLSHEFAQKLNHSITTYLRRKTLLSSDRKFLPSLAVEETLDIRLSQEDLPNWKWVESLSPKVTQTIYPECVLSQESQVQGLRCDSRTIENRADFPRPWFDLRLISLSVGIMYSSTPAPHLSLTRCPVSLYRKALNNTSTVV